MMGYLHHKEFKDWVGENFVTPQVCRTTEFHKRGKTGKEHYNIVSQNSKHSSNDEE